MTGRGEGEGVVPLVVGVVAVEDVDEAAPGSVVVCWAAKAEFKRGFRVDVPVERKR